MRTPLQIFDANVVSVFRPNCSIKKIDRVFTLLFLVGVILRNVILDVGLIVASLVVSREAGNNVAKLGSLYGFKNGFIISVLIVSYRVFASAAVSCFQVVVTLSLRIVVRRFNKHLSNVKSEKTDGKELAQELRYKMQTHMDLSIIVSKCDRIFRNHTLLCLALAVPRTINAARNFQALSSGTIPADASKIAAVMSNLLNAVVDLIAFTAIPATVNTALSESERALCQNTALWKHYDPEVYQVATAFLLQTRQATLGFTAGGIVTITHTLLFT
ncbi:CRE-GUR-5 protein, partial [Aphelenchoides avenae]